MKKEYMIIYHKMYFLKNVFLIGVFSFLVLSSCRQNNKETKEKEVVSLNQLPDPVEFDLDKIKKRDTLIAIVDNSSTGYFIYKGQPMGYEYELLNLLAQDLDVNLKLVVTKNIDEAFVKLNEGKGDIVAHNLTVTKSRKEQVNFTIP